METIIGFVAGYLAGARDGRDGLERLRTSFHAIRTSPEVRKLAGEAMAVAEMAVRRGSGRGNIGGAVGEVTNMIVRRAAGIRGSRAA